MENKKLLRLSRALVLIFLWSVLAVSICSVSGKVSASELEETGNLRRLVTSNNPDFYSVIETDGSTIAAGGVHKSDIPIGVGISGVSVSTVFHAESDGSYSAEINYIPVSEGYYIFYIWLESGVMLSYLMKYADGWYFPDNGLSLLNGQKLEKAYEAAPEAAVYYISATADKSEIEAALSQIDGIVKEVCGGETDDYKKAYLLNRWVADNIYYDHDAAETSVTLDTVAIYNVLNRRRTTCAGFANTYSALLEAAGIRSLNLKGAAETSDVSYSDLPTAAENHEFSAFWYEEQKRWVYADACWSGAGDYENGETRERITYDKYFDITGEAFSLNHRVDKAEERFYFKALETLEQGSPAQTEDTSGAAAETSPQSTAENDTDKTDSSVPPFSSEKLVRPSTNGGGSENGKSIAPFVFIGLIGALVIAAGIILAANKRKK